MECPKCKYVMVEDPEVGLATCPSCGHVIEMSEGPDLPSPGGSMGMIPIGGVFRAAGKAYKENMHRFLGIWAIPALLGFVINFFILFSSYDVFLSSGGVLSQSQYWSYTMVLLVSMLFPLFINIFFSAAIIRMASDYFMHGETKLSSGFSILGEKLPLIMGASIVFAFPIVLGDLFCFGIPAMVCCYWWMFAVVIIALENAHLNEAFSVSKEFATSRYSFSFALVLMILIILLVHGILGFLSPVPSMILFLSAPAWMSSLQVAIIDSVVLAIVEWILYPFLITAIVAFYLSGRREIKKQIASSSVEKEGDVGEGENSDSVKTEEKNGVGKEEEGTPDSSNGRVAEEMNEEKSI